MHNLTKQIRGWMTVAGATLAILIAPQQALAHCDALDGPVIVEARQALEKGDVTPVLKWVGAADETEIRAAFAQTLQVRQLDPAARELADRYFFETLVRVHRAGEGAPYTGLKPAGTVTPVVAMADRALDEGKVDNLAGKVAAHTEAGIRERFRHALETRKHAGDSVAAGREAVAAYVTYVHYVEGIANAVHAEAHHGETKAASHQH
jgi:hypothetical protein